jgi:membrane associated rhomboid family serine protease
MGITSRDYYRDDERGSGGPSWMSDTPSCRWIVFVTVAAFILQIVLTSPGRGFRRESLLEDWLILDPDAVFAGQIWRLLTYAFLHDRYSLWHLLMNMLVLWWFGGTIERMYGSREFLWFYLTAAVVSGLGFLALGLMLGAHNPALGASGAVMAVFMLYATYFPRQQIWIFGLIPVEIWLLVLIYIAVDLHPVLLQLGGENIQTGVANAAHLSGLFFGWLYRQNHWRLSAGFVSLTGGWRQRWRRMTAGRNLKVYRPEEPVGNIEEELDRILAKIHDHGSDSLTDRERATLTRASEQYKNR